MERKDNGYEEKPRTEEIATANTGAEGQESGPKTASAVAGKFKDVDALIKAYDCLQAEFTRRSQRLKELEREAENLKAAKEEKSAAAMAEKLRKNAERTKTAGDEFDSFVSELEGANVRARNKRSFAEEGPAEGEEDARVESRSAEQAMQSVGATAVGKENAPSVVSGLSAYDADGGSGETPLSEVPFVEKSREELSSDELYERASRDEQVRLKIIGEYLSSVGRAGAPLIRGGAGTLAAPPMKAKTVEEAGRMALRWFKKDGVQA